MPPDKMSRNGEKNAQVENLIWCILTALRRHLKTPNLLTDPVFMYSYNYRRAVELVVGVGHALVQPLQGEVGGVEGLLQEHVA